MKEIRKKEMKLKMLNYLNLSAIRVCVVIIKQQQKKMK